MNRPKMVRQGDILLIREDAPLDLSSCSRIEPETGRLILARGEATGHHHSVVVADGAELIEAAEDIFLRIMAASSLDHQEHGSIALEPGTYRVARQVEYRPRDLPRRVAD